MGAKTASGSRKSRASLDCSLCERHFRTPEMLENHKNNIHTKARVKALLAKNLKTTTATKNDLKQAKKLAKVVLKRCDASKAKSPVLEVQPTLDDVVSEEKEEQVDCEKSEDNGESISYMFMCPVCPNVFPEFVSCYRHIQKNHCVNQLGLEVKPDSPHLVKPIKISCCTLCDERLNSNVTEHKCSKKQPSEEEHISLEKQKLFVCDGCNKECTSVYNFLAHIPTLHASEMYSLVFENSDDFHVWKEQMQLDTKTKFVRNSTFETQNEAKKHYYSCISIGFRKKLCPAMIIVQQYNHLKQIHFYSKHYGHKTKPFLYNNQHSIEKFFPKPKQDEELKQNDTNNIDRKTVYTNFKQIIDNVVVNAKAINVEQLRTLLKTALEMSDMLNGYLKQNYKPVNVPQPNPSPEIVTKAVEIPTPERQIEKRRVPSPIANITPAKRTKRAVTFNDVISELENDFLGDSSDSETLSNEDAMVTPKIVSAYSLKTGETDPGTNENETKAEKEEAPKRDVIKHEIPKTANSRNNIKKNNMKSPTFNDTYRDFVEKNFGHSEGKKTSKSNVDIRKVSDIKVPVDTKKVSNVQIQTVPKFDPISVPELNHTGPMLVEQKRKKEVIGASKVIKKNGKENETTNKVSKSSYDVKTVEFQNSPMPDAVNKAKKIKPKDTKKRLRTKLGQYRPGFSPKKRSLSLDNRSFLDTSPLNKSNRISLGTPKVDTYEVREQENDCNILILKI